jgi:hypothetical protein
MWSGRGIGFQPVREKTRWEPTARRVQIPVNSLTSGLELIDLEVCHHGTSVG